MKKINSLFFVFITLCLLMSNSCSSDSDEEDNPPQTDETAIVQNSIKGKFFNMGEIAYNFIDNEYVEVWSNIINDKGEYYYLYNKLTYKVYIEKSYIGIKDINNSLPYIYENKELYIYDNEQNKTKGITKPDYFKPESKQPDNPTEPEVKIDTIRFYGACQLLHFKPSRDKYSDNYNGTVKANMDIVFPNMYIKFSGVNMPKEYDSKFNPSVYTIHSSIINNPNIPIIIEYKDENKQFIDTIKQPNYAWWQYSISSNNSAMYFDFKGKHAYYKGNFALGYVKLITWTKGINYYNDGIDFNTDDLKYTDVQLSPVEVGHKVVIKDGVSWVEYYDRHTNLSINFNENLKIELLGSIPYEENKEISPLELLKSTQKKESFTIKLKYANDHYKPIYEDDFFKNITKREWSIDNEKLTLTFHYSTYKSTIIIPISDIQIMDN